tara:strand:- start:1701 stop:2546 length:846 start_codon:yes stop_codon:yes gene_type:complete
MSWTNMNEGTAVTKETALELAKKQVDERIKKLQERHRANLCALVYGEAKVGKSGICLDSRTEKEIESESKVMVLDFDNGSESTWRTNWDSDSNIEILNPVVRDEEGFAVLSETEKLAEAFISRTKDYINEGKSVKFVFDGVDKWLRMCFMVMTDDKRSTQAKFLPILWGQRNKKYEDLVEKITDGLECDRFFITHMKDVYEGVNNPNPVGRIPNLRETTMDKMNQVMKVYRQTVGIKNSYYATLESSKTNTPLVGKTWNFLNIENGKVNWKSITELQDGEL